MSVPQRAALAALAHHTDVRLANHEQRLAELERPFSLQKQAELNSLADQYLFSTTPDPILVKTLQHAVPTAIDWEKKRVVKWSGEMAEALYHHDNSTQFCKMRKLEAEHYDQKQLNFKICRELDAARVRIAELERANEQAKSAATGLRESLQSSQQNTIAQIARYSADVKDQVSNLFRGARDRVQEAGRKRRLREDDTAEFRTIIRDLMGAVDQALEPQP